MVSDAYVDFETAKLLKKKGFKGYCNRIYIISPNGKFCIKSVFEECDTADDGYLMPTLQMAMEWLRDKHYIFLEIKHEFGIYTITPKDMLTDGILGDSSFFDSHYNYICNMAIKHCLENLIKENN